MFKKFIPSTLIGRSIIIIFVPIIVLVILTALVFYQTSWNIISKRLAESVVADINVLVKLIDDNLLEYANNIAEKDFKMKINIKTNEIINPLSNNINRGILSRRLDQSLKNLEKTFNYDLSNIEEGVVLSFQSSDFVLSLLANKYIDVESEIKRLNKKKSELNKSLEISNNRLTNDKFVQNAKQELIDQEKQNVQNLSSQIESINSTLKSLDN